MSEIAQGRNCRVEIGLTEAAPDIVTAITAANPGVVSSAAHGQANGAVGYLFEVLGMDEIDGQAYRVANTAAGTFELERIDATGYAAFISGSAIAVATWATLSQSTEYQLGGGPGTLEDSTVLLDKKDKQKLITQGVESVTINVRALTEDNAAMARVRSVARALGYLVFRITLSDGAQRIFRGQPSLPGESLAVKGLGSGSLSVAIKGDIIYLPSL